MALAILAISCDSFFDINLKDQATLEDTMSRSSSVKRYLAHLYYYIPRDEEIRNHEGGTVLRSDELLPGKTTYNVTWLNVRRGQHSASVAIDDNSANFWSRYYVAINECTTFLDHVDLDKEDSPALVKHMKAEARFLRAYYYYVLLRFYGPVIIWGDQAASQDVIAEELDRDPLEKNISFIVDELDKAAQDLSMEVDEGGLMTLESNKGRVTKGAALALKARVLLMAASPLFNGQNGTGLYNSLVNKRGEKLFPDYQPEKWEDAAKAAKDVIDLNYYSLTKVNEPGNTDLQNAAASYQTVWFLNWGKNKEIIWGWWYRTWGDDSQGNGAEISFAVPAGKKIALEGYSHHTPSLKLADAFPMWETGRYPVLGYYKSAGELDLSRPIIDEQSGYEATGWTENYQQTIDVDPAWAKPFKAHNSTVGRDARYYASLVPNGFWWPSATTNSGGPVRYSTYDSTEACEPWSATAACNQVGYVWRRMYKANNPLHDLAADYASIRYIYPAFRLAEVYLTYAEACNEKPLRDVEEAIKYLDLVRDRSGLPGIRQSYPDIDFDGADAVSTVSGVSRTGKEWLRWIILQEKMCEFNFEGQRHYDMIRWMKAEEEYNTENWTLHVRSKTYDGDEANPEGCYERVSTDYIGGRAVFSKRDYLLPFGSKQISEMTNYTQNPGW